MKKFFVLLLCLMLFAHPVLADTTVEDVERTFGVMVNQADSETLKQALLDFDKEFASFITPYEQYRAKILVRLRSMGQSQWVTNYMGKNQRTVALLTTPYEDLVQLKEDINLAMWMSAKWQEVTVPQGTWKVGEDIPAGHWTVKCAEGASSARVSWGEKLDKNNQDISFSGRYSMSNYVYNKSRYPEKDNYQHEYSFQVKEGDYIQIENGSVVFMPYVGKPSFTFK